MANRFRKLSQAEADLDSIWTYIATDNIAAADNLLSRIGSVLEMLAQNPLAGRARADLTQELRSFAVANHAIRRRGNCTYHEWPTGRQRR
jgi:toxin ParE1/3/4